ncbi:hypothetical protein PC116_g24369 [Phytophthora cactorum]|nr:hypothetical protein PC114_g22482 [Phytophthora cactorum]KAG4227241.1 hypothetical protein PC116_g24369 [Phytophthora cactorum]
MGGQKSERRCALVHRELCTAVVVAANAPRSVQSVSSARNSAKQAEGPIGHRFNRWCSEDRGRTWIRNVLQ